MTTDAPDFSDQPIGGPNSGVKKRRRLPRWAVGAIAAFIALFVGVSIGNSADPTDSAEYRELADRLETATVEHEQTERDLDETRSALAETTDQVATLQADLEDAQGAADVALADMEAHRQALDQREAELDERAEELDTRRADLDDREGAIANREEAVTVAEQEAEARPRAAASAPAAPASVSYRNCSEARAAGAAPVRRGDPGYASHLDRDGDGVGCE
ncbi:excalibur calcium-binding domain-containing protein [Georgenia satyanarayanai]|uniref:excalibur calcium-binding domain-containing protein n=1 Tax=Georgenia satyanarayanai TaxID=860221 RepID=UPI0012649674|nr:excalibur calcium-binding domain-containing protein [Georgenia satyanarayanai]